MTVTEERAGTSLLPMEFKFNSTNQTVRAEMVNNQPYFVAKDVCCVLAIKEADAAVRKLDNDEKLTRKVFGSGQKRSMWLINESGLYNLIFRSTKPEAKEFRKWVTFEVLPAIRKTGTFTKPAQKQLASGNERRKHNRLTPNRIVDMLSDVAKIEDTELRLRLFSKIMGGPIK